MHDDRSKQELVAALLRQYRKELTAPQMDVLLGKADSGSPLYLFMACQKLLQFGVFETFLDDIKALPGRKYHLVEIECVVYSIVGQHVHALS